MASHATIGQDITTGFQNVAQTEDPHFYINLLDVAEELDFVRESKRHMLALLNVQAGQAILDIGCGVGHEAQRLARLVGTYGRVVGVDRNEPLLAEARRRAAGLDLPLDYLLGDGHALDFHVASFDACRAERVFMYLADPVQTLGEMIRVVRPGGRILIYDFDLEAFMVHGADHDITRRLVRLLADSMPNGWMGRRLPALFREAGLVEITVRTGIADHPFPHFKRIFGGIVDKAQATGMVSTIEAAAWWQALAQADQAGSFFAAVPSFIVCGQKP